MADERTDDQKAADKLLDQAVEAQAVAYARGETHGVVTGFVGVYAITHYAEDGDAMTAIGVCTPDDNTMPAHVGIGLLESALVMYRARVLGPEDI